MQRRDMTQHDPPVNLAHAQRLAALGALLELLDALLDARCAEDVPAANSSKSMYAVRYLPPNATARTRSVVVCTGLGAWELC